MELEKYCTCSKKKLDDTPGVLLSMVMDEDGTYHDECRLCGKIINFEIWYKHNLPLTSH